MLKLLLTVTALAVSSCAFTNIPITLPSSTGTGLSGGDNRQIVVAPQLADNRAHKDKCGIQKNNYNAETAQAICSTDPSHWVAQILKTELRAAGFSVIPANEARSSALHINGTLLPLFVEPVVGWTTVSLESDVKVRLMATSETGLAAERTFFVKGLESGMAATATNFQTSMNRATKEIVSEMVAAILSLMNRYEQIGSITPLSPSTIRVVVL